MSTSEENSSCSHVNEGDSFPVLKKSAPPLKFINSIPSQAQKGFKNFNINFTCLDVCEHYIAIGTSVGVVYLYDRKEEKLTKLKNKDSANSITCVKLLVSLECLVAIGTKKGAVLAFKVPFESNYELEKFKVEGLHQAPVTALEWAKNGIKFFSGDSNGIVVCTEIDHFEHQSKSQIVLEENSEIVQLSYTHLMLLVSTLHRSFLYDFKQNEVSQVGQKERKCLDKFGATFFEDCNKLCVYASRPGQRIWKSSCTGIISETIILKTSLIHSQTDLTSSSKEFQFGPLKIYQPKLLLTWSVDRIVLIDPEIKAIKSICDSVNIVDVATSNDEIFVLHGLRNIMRFAIYSNTEENSISGGIDVTPDTMLALKELNISAKIEAPKVFNWIKRKFSEASAFQDEYDLNTLKTERSNTVNVILPQVVELSSDCPQVKIEEEPELVKPSIDQTATKKFPERIDDDIVFRPKKKKKRKKKVNEKIDALHLDLAPSEHSEVPIQTNLNETDVDTRQENTITELPDVATDTVDNIEELPHQNILIPSKNKTEDSADILRELPKLDVNIESTESLQSVNEEPVSPIDIYSSINFDNPLIEAKSNNSLDSAQYIKEKNVSNIDDDNNNDDFEMKKNLNSAQDNNKDNNVSKTEGDNIVSHNDKLENYNYDFPKYGVECVQYNVPAPIVSLSASNHHVFCVDNQNAVFISDFPVFGFKWIKLKQLGEQVAVSPSEHIVWILYQGTVYATKRQNSNLCLKSATWVSIATSVLYIAVDDTSSWYISFSGNLFTNQNISSQLPYNYPKQVCCPLNILQVACRDEVVWVLTTDGKVYCKVNSESAYEKTEWQVLELPSELSISMFAFGNQKEVYMIGYDGTLWFRTDVTALNPHGHSSTLQVESSLYVYQSCGKMRKVVEKVFNSGLFNALIHGEQQALIASSESGVWWCKSMDTLLYSYQKHVIGHSWDVVIPRGTLSTTKWSMISAEGLVGSEGTVWGIDIMGELICFSLKSTNSVVVELPTSTILKCIKSTPVSLWVLTTEGNILIRREMSERCPQGVWWQPLDTSQICDVMLCHISCSAETVWACDAEGRIYMRIGTLSPPAGTTLSQVWIQVDSDISGSALVAKKVYVGPKSYMVWAIDNRDSVYVRSNITTKSLVGDQWIFVPGPNAKQLCISQDGVWLLKNSGKIFRRFGITRSNPSGDYWKQIPGNLSFLSVTVDDNLWGVQDTSLCCHNSKTLQYESRSINSENTEDVSEDDWEDVIAGPSDSD